MFSSKLKRHQRKLKIEVKLISFIQGFLFKQSYRNVVNHNIQYVSISRLWYGSHNNRQGYNILVCIVKYSWLHTHNIFLANKPHTHTHTHTLSLSPWRVNYLKNIFFYIFWCIDITNVSVQHSIPFLPMLILSICPPVLSLFLPLSLSLFHPFSV